MTMRWLHNEPEGTGAEEWRAQSPPNTRARLTSAPAPVALSTVHDDAADDRAPQPQWVSLGPSTTLFGQTTGRQAISGRARSIAVEPTEGRRMVVGTSGGSWFSGDAGVTWLPLDTYFSSADLGVPLRDSNALSVGAVAVEWGAAASGADDLVVVGMGEIETWPEPSVSYPHPLPRARQGMGIRSTRTPLSVAGNPTGDAWAVEHVLTHGVVYAIASAGGGVFWAATSQGLFVRAPAGTWTEVLSGGAGLGRCTDAVFVQGVGVFVARVPTSAAAGWELLHFATPASPGRSVTIPAIGGASTISRVALGASRPTAVAPGDCVVYALATGPRLWRIPFGPGAGAAASVSGLPPDLLGRMRGRDRLDRSFYDIGVAVDPLDQDRIVVAGQVANGLSEAALFVSRVTRTGATFSVSMAPPNDPLADRTGDQWVGEGVHGDVHCVRWVVDAPGDATAPAWIWVGCDGGVFRVTDPRTPHPRGTHLTAEARNRGLATIEAIHLSRHSPLPGLILCGTQDNGTMRNEGLEAWRVFSLGDGGGTVFHPTFPLFVLAERIGAEWHESNTGGRSELRANQVFPPTRRSGNGSASQQVIARRETERHTRASFFFRPAVLQPITTATSPPPPAFVLVGTNRVWMSPNWLAPLSATQTWVTLPEQRDPYVTRPLTGQKDVLDLLLPGTPFQDCSAVRVIDVFSPSTTTGGVGSAQHRIFAMTDKGVYMIAVEQGPPANPLPLRALTPTVVLFAKGAVGSIPADQTLSALAIHDGARNQLFIGTAIESAAGPARGQLFWTSHSTVLPAGLPVDAHVFAIATRRATNDEPAQEVYVGTNVGVFRGRITAPAPGAPLPTIAWSHFSDGLPESACIDLVLHGNLLRAALAGRGVWEIDLGPLGASPPGVAPQLFLRAHDHDLARGRVPGSRTVEDDPFSGGTGGTVPAFVTPLSPFVLDRSPDIRVQRARGAPAFVPSSLPWSVRRPPRDVADRYAIWVLQAALFRQGLHRVAQHGEDAHDPVVPQFNTLRTADRFAVRNRIAGHRAGTISRRTWNGIVGATQPEPAFATPPDHADVTVGLIDEPDTRTGEKRSCAAVTQSTVHVVVHSRHWAPTRSPIRVILLSAPIPPGTIGDATMALSFPADLETRVPAITGPTPPGTALPGTPWEVLAVSNVLAGIEPRTPPVVSFPVTMPSGAPFETNGILLVAIIHAADDPFRLPLSAAATVNAVITQSRHVAARSVRAAR